MLGLLLLAGSVLAALPPDRTAAVAAGLRGSVLAPFLSAHRSLERHAAVGRQLEELQAEHDSLARELARLRPVRRENRQLRRLLDLPYRVPEGVVAVELEPARIRVAGARSFAVAVGPDPDLQAPAGVFTPEGLVGVVRSITDRSGRGDFWTHPDFRVSVRTDSGEATGVVRSSQGDGPVGMVFEGAPYQTKIPPGTRLVTSGLGGIYPPDVPVGTVRETSGVESGWARSYSVRPAVRPGTVDMALVWRRPERTP